MPFTVQAFGSNGSGQLGIGHLEDVSHPVKCQFPRGNPTSRPVKVAAGGNHTLLLCEDGSLYATGSNGNGRCGLSTSNRTLTEFYPVQFEDERAHKVQTFQFVAATWEASIFVASDGQVFTSGSGNFGELGQGESVIESPVPRKLSGFPPPGLDIIDIAASMRHCVVVLANGQAYGWGAARKGQLGQPRVRSISLPRRLSWEAIDGQSNHSYYAYNVVCCRDLTCIIEAPSPEARFAVLGSDPTAQLRDNSLYHIGRWKNIAASWSGIFVLQEDLAISGRGKSWIPANSSRTIRPRHIAAGSEHVLAETEDGQILAVGWGEHGNCGEPTGEGGRVEDHWNEISAGRLLGAGCATSWIFHD